ncbi:MAG: hypothetical protein ACTJLL_00625 [Anaplasma sp.]
MTRVKWIGCVFLVLVCGLGALAYPVCRLLTREVMLSLLEVARAGSTVFAVESITYEDLEVQGVNQVLLKGFRMGAASSSALSGSLEISYDVVRNVFNVAPHEGAMQILSALERGSEDGQSAAEWVECKTGANYTIGFRDNILLQAFKKLILGKKVENEIVEFSYLDDEGFTCLDSATGKYVSLYDKGRLSLGTSFASESESETIVNSEFFRNEDENGSGGLVFRAENISLHRLQPKNKGREKSDLNVPLLEFQSDEFSVLVRGAAFIPEECTIVSLERCKSNFSFELKGFDNFSKFLMDLVQSQVSDKGRIASEDYAAVFKIIADTVRYVSSLRGENGGEVVTLTVKSDGEKITIGSLPLAEFSELILGKMKEAQDSGLLSKLLS